MLDVLVKEVVVLVMLLVDDALTVVEVVPHNSGFRGFDLSSARARGTGITATCSQSEPLKQTQHTSKKHSMISQSTGSSDRGR